MCCTVRCWSIVECRNESFSLYKTQVVSIVIIWSGWPPIKLSTSELHLQSMASLLWKSSSRNVSDVGNEGTNKVLSNTSTNCCCPWLVYLTGNSSLERTTTSSVSLTARVRTTTATKRLETWQRLARYYDTRRSRRRQRENVMKWAWNTWISTERSYMLRGTLGTIFLQ